MSRLFLFFPVLFNSQVRPAETEEGSYRGDFPDESLGTEITPEGYLYTGYGELMFLIGNPPKAASQRTRTLEKGYLPVFHYTYRDGAIQYGLTTFAYRASAEGESRRLLNFVRIAAVNTGTTERTSYFNVAFRYTGKVDEPSGQGNHRFRRPAIPAKPGDYSQPGVKFDPEWTYEFRDDLAIRAGKVVYEFTTTRAAYALVDVHTTLYSS